VSCPLRQDGFTKRASLLKRIRALWAPLLDAPLYLDFTLYTDCLKRCHGKDFGTVCRAVATQSNLMEAHTLTQRRTNAPAIPPSKSGRLLLAAVLLLASGTLPMAAQTVLSPDAPAVKEVSTSQPLMADKIVPAVAERTEPAAATTTGQEGAPVAPPAFEPKFSVGAGIRTSYDHSHTDGTKDLDQFSLDHARLYFGGDVTKNISVMFNTDYQSSGNSMQILDAVGEFHTSPKLNIWFGRFLPPSDRANLYGPFYANEWDVYSDGVQDGYTFVYQGRDNGAAYWGDFKAGSATIKASAGVFDGKSSDGKNGLLYAGRVQVDFLDPENGYYQNGTYYGDKNLLAIAGATEVQTHKTATTADFLLEKKIVGGGAFTVESEYSRYNGLGGYDSNYNNSQGAYGLASYLIPKAVGQGKFEVLGKYAVAEFTDGVAGKRSYRQKTAEANFNYILKQFDAKVISFYRNASFNAVGTNNWQVGVGLQLQLSSTFSMKTR
jgi:hypothetical protein